MVTVFRDLLRRLSRNRVIRKRLPAEFGGGLVYCSPEALLSMWKPGWRSKQAQGLMSWVRRYVHPGMCVWDLGANQGIFSFAASARAGPAGHVVAFEPDLFLVDLLRRSVASGAHLGAPVSILPMAVGSCSCLAEFVIARTDRALNHLSEALGNPRTGGARDVVLVPCVPLDWLLDHLPAPDFLKVDVEGAELAVVEGGERLFREVRPLMIVETAPENGAAMAALMQRHGYVMLDADTDGDVALSAPAWNTVAVPSERIQDILNSRQGQ